MTTATAIQVKDIDFNRLCGSTGFSSRQVREAFQVKLADDVVAEREVSALVSGKDPDEAYREILEQHYPEGGAHYYAALRHIATFFRH